MTGTARSNNPGGQSRPVDAGARLRPRVGKVRELQRTGNAARKFGQIDDYVFWRMRRLLIKKRGRNLRAGQVQQWTSDWFHQQGLYRLRGTIRYPKAA